MLYVDELKGERYDIIPPIRMNFVGTLTDFIEVGNEFLTYFKKFADLKSSDKVLDIGSGIGRMAIPLTKYLNSSGEYQGFDIVSHGVKWCKNRITPKYPNFHFQLANIYNQAYLPSGKVLAENFRFPFENNHFNLAYATSVFTHLMKPATINYLKETHRVLTPGGRAILTFFLLNNKSRNNMVEGKSSVDFKFQVDGIYTNNLENPEWAVAYDEEEIHKLVKEIGFEILPTQYGKWDGRSDGLSYQDLLILQKK